MKDLAGTAHWGAQQPVVSRRIPSRLYAIVSDTLTLLEPYVGPGKRVLEVGCAPGKYLIWCRSRGADIYGVDYEPQRALGTQALLGPDADIRCEDFMQTTLPPGSFDCVYSVGVIEHFDDPRPIVRQHVEMLKPGGTAVAIIPHYGGLYGSIQWWLEPHTRAPHNTDIMSPDALRALCPAGLCSRVEARTAGRVSAFHLGVHAIVPNAVAHLVRYGVNALAWIQPVHIRALAPLLVLKMTRA